MKDAESDEENRARRETVLEELEKAGKEDETSPV